MALHYRLYSLHDVFNYKSLILFVDGVNIALSGSWEEVTLKEKHNLFLTELDSQNIIYMQKPESYVSFVILKFRLLTLLALISVWNAF